MTRPIGLLFALLWSATAAIAGEADDLSGPEIKALFSGATMRGTFVADGSAWAETTTKSGRVLDVLKGRKHVGAWFVKDDWMCYVYYGNPPAKPCYVIAQDGNLFWFRDSQSGEIVARAKKDKLSRR